MFFGIGLRSLGLVRNIILTATVAFTFVAYRYWRHIQDMRQIHNPQLPEHCWMRVGHVSKLYMYPLKSGMGISMDEANCTKTGLQRIVPADDEQIILKDRMLSVYGTRDNKLISGKNYPRLVRVSVDLNSTNKQHRLVFKAPGMKAINVHIPDIETATEVTIQFWANETVNGYDCGPEIATWLSQYLLNKSDGLRLAYNGGKRPRKIPKLLQIWPHLSSNDSGLYSDVSSVMLINMASFDDLQRRLNNESDDTTMDAKNFRANIILDNDGTHPIPYDEDNWDWMKIGADVILRNVKDCTRCTFINVDADSGVRDPNRQPLVTLETYRRCQFGPETAPILGINMGVKQPGIIKIKDPIFITYK